MDSIDTDLWYLFWLAFYPMSCKWVNQYISRDFLRWLSQNNWPHICWICGGIVTHKNRSLDHLIPKEICYELNLEGLIVDHRNWAIAHRNCNTKRGSSLHLLPERVREEIHLRRKEKSPIARGFPDKYSQSGLL